MQISVQIILNTHIYASLERYAVSIWRYTANSSSVNGLYYTINRFLHTWRRNLTYRAAW